MTDFDPTDPWGAKSPWDEAQPQQTAPEVPVTNQPNAVATPENVTLSFKGGAGYDASLLVVRAGSLAELDEMLDKEAAHLKSVMEKASRVQAYSTSLNSGVKAAATSAPPAAQPSFNQGTGQVQYSQPAQAPFGGGVPDHDDRGTTTCVHGNRTHRTGSNWEAMFCPAREKSEQCAPAWKDKKTGKFVVKG